MFWDLSTSIVWKLDTAVENRVSPRRPMDENITEWNPGLDSSIKPNGRGEDKINESLKQEESEESKGNDQKNNDPKIRGHMVYEGRRKQTKSGKGKKKSMQDAEAAKDLGRDVLKPFTSKRTLR